MSLEPGPRIAHLGDMKLRSGIAGLVGLLVTIQAQAIEKAEIRNAPVGVGSLVSRVGQDVDYALVLEGSNHFKQRTTQFGIRQYGFAQSRLELGTSSGLNLAATSGITVFGIQGEQKVSPHLGIEPFSGRVALNTDAANERFYEWFPAASAGLQFQAGGCRVLPLVKGGGAVGNLGKSGLGPAFRSSHGAGAHFNCDRWDLAFETSRIRGGGLRADLSAIDFSLNQYRSGLKLGMRAERLEMPSSQHLENRVMFVLRGDPFGSL